MVAIKVMKKKAASKQFANEVEKLKLLEHPNIIKVVGASDTGTWTERDGSEHGGICYIALELCSNHTFFDWIAYSPKLDERVVRFYFVQMMEAIKYLHCDKRMSHRDLKPENIFVDENFNLKVADFGTATEEIENSTRYGTADYMAPEVNARKPYRGTAADIYACGVSLFMMSKRDRPFSNEDADYANRKHQIRINAMDNFWLLNHRKAP
jgi:serine/threonine protein kinase